MSPTSGAEPLDAESYKAAIRLAARDSSLNALRSDLARFVANCFAGAGTELHALGHIVGPDRVAGVSPFGHGSDETVAVSTLLRIASQLVSASTDLFEDGRAYAAAALLRQLVEVEYLAWAMETRSGEGERWLRSDKRQRQDFFTPAKLRKASGGKFRGQDYGYHCEFGGHPVPGASLLLQPSPETLQLLLSDAIGHAGRIWEHLVGWAQGSQYGDPIHNRTCQMRERFAVWKSADPLAGLPPPPG